MNRILLTLTTLAFIACDRSYVAPEIEYADDSRDAAPKELSDLELKLQLADEAGVTGRRRSSGACAAELCASDLGFLDVYVSEVMADPTACTDATGEWIELHNRTEQSVDVNGLILEDRSSGARSTLSGAAVIPAGGYAVIGKGTTPCGVTADGRFTSAVSLNNDGDSLYLRRPDDGLVDIVLAWGASTPGVAFETSPMDSWRWLPAVQPYGAERATPHDGPEADGYVRPLAQVWDGGLVISEVMADPSCAYDRCEWIEIENRAGVPVALDGLVLVDGGGNEGAIDADAVIEPYERLVVGRYRAADWTATHVVPGAFYGNVGLNNDGEQLLLVDGDRVLFMTPWFDTITANTSWEYTTPWWADGSSLADWSLATDDMGFGDAGTPGY